MVRSPSVGKTGLKRGAWSEEEDNKLRAYVQRYGHWNWRQLPKFAGLARCGKSCRLRWMNYLKPGLKKGKYTKEEEEMIFKLHQELGNKWSTIAAELPGRTDNEIKNYWNGHLKKRMQQDPKSRRETKEISQNMHVMDQKEQDSSISLLESSDWKMELKANYISAADADASTEDESFMKSFQSLSTEADSSNVLDGLISPSASCKSTEPVFSNASNDLISPSTSYQSTFSNSEEPYVDDSFGDFWTEPFSFDTSYNSQSIHQLPPAEQGVMFPFSSILECDFDMFNQF